jgi:hypothetical protein
VPRVVRIPKWACSKFAEHGVAHVCADCLTIFKEQGSTTTGFDMPPRVHFGRGWHGIGAAHWFAADDSTVFPSRDGKRLLAAAICGGICEVTLAWAPRAGRECGKCLRAITKRAIFYQTRN